MRRISPACGPCLLSALLVVGCSGGVAEGPASVTLVSVASDALIEGTPDVEPQVPISWDFAAGTTPQDAVTPDEALNALFDVANLGVADGALRGTATGENSALYLRIPDEIELKGSFHSLEVRLQVGAGESAQLAFSGAPEFDRDEWIETIEEDGLGAPFFADLTPGDEFETLLFSTAGSMIGSLPMSALRNLVIQPADAATDFAIESIRLKSLEEHLQSVPSGVSWQGLGDVYRETFVTRTPERVSFEVTVPPSPWLDLSIGTIEPGPARFVVEVTAGGSTRELVRRTVTTANQWTRLPVNLDEWAGQTVTLTLAGEAQSPGRLLYWGGPVIRSRGEATTVGAESEARAQLAAGQAAPKRILFILADTLRRDRLPWHGGERDNAPHLSRIAEEGTVFTKNVSQGTWTKVSVPSILTSLYPSSHGIADIPDRLPSSVTTLGESLREAGYATYATSSVPFTGKLTNLHQGIETLSERGSISELPHSEAKTARTYVDRLLPWIEENAETPFFVFLHVFDPHSPFEPYPPYDTLYTDEGEIEAHRERIEAVQEEIEDDHMRGDVMPTAEELAAAEVDADAFVDTEHDWYDASIRGMDEELGRVMERLEQLGLAEDTLIVFMSDHGEEFLEHGRHFHGNNAYGEMLNVPLMMWWPGVIPAGRSDEVVQSIDVMPTVLDLARIAAPDQVQGQSLLPLMLQGEAPSRFGWVSRPAFAQRQGLEDDSLPPEEQVDSLVMVADGWKLIRNSRRPDDWPEFELYDYDNDPMDQINVADDNPDIVSGMAEELAAWHERALAARVEEAEASDLSPEEEARLRALGYIQ
ncbi:MAG: sulfatase-like hydrolase/transferase [Acidobacteria bacterium]|nr:sulfatase-like hydrolase/transferase [Acidobacteriota bacterium]